jgi:hypothetical protein
LLDAAVIQHDHLRVVRHPHERQQLKYTRDPASPGASPNLAAIDRAKPDHLNISASPPKLLLGFYTMGNLGAEKQAANRQPQQEQSTRWQPGSWGESSWNFFLTLLIINAFFLPTLQELCLAKHMSWRTGPPRLKILE